MLVNVDGHEVKVALGSSDALEQRGEDAARLAPAVPFSLEQGHISLLGVKVDKDRLVRLGVKHASLEGLQYVSRRKRRRLNSGLLTSASASRKWSRRTAVVWRVLRAARERDVEARRVRRTDMVTGEM